MKTTRTAALPSFYTHTIGSLPRPAVLRELLGRRLELGEPRFTELMNEMVIFAIRLQELAGLDVIGDGEWRRVHYVGEFLRRVGGFERVREFSHQGQTKLTDVVIQRMNGGDSVFAADAQFLAQHTQRVRKFALPSPFLIAIRYWTPQHSAAAYPTMQHFMDHLTEILRAEAQALVAAGIDIVQLDDPALTYFCDRRLMDRGDTHDERLRRNWNVDKEFPLAVQAINQIVEGLGAEIHLHCCHSVYKRQSDVIGDYKPILPRLADAKIDRVNLEFAYQGTGQIDDLKLLPSNLAAGVGVVDVRGERLQSVQEIETLARNAARVLGKDRVALNPDCGFAPDAGEPPTIDEAFEKLKRMCQAAVRLRGE